MKISSCIGDICGLLTFFCSTLNMLLYLWSNLLWSMCSDRNTPWDLGDSDAENAVGWGFLGFVFILDTQKASVKISKVHSSFDYCRSLLVGCRSVTSKCVCLVWAIVLVTPHAFSVCFFPVLRYPVYSQWWFFFFFFLLLSPLPKLLSMCYGNAARLSTHEVPAFIGGWYE